MSRRISRRDRCYLAGIRAAKLTPDQAAAAWLDLATRLEDMGDLDLPKFRTLYAAIRSATISARRIDRGSPFCAAVADNGR